MALIVFVFFLLVVADLVRLYKTDPTSFIVSSPEQLRAVAFAAIVTSVFSIGFLCSIFLLIAMTVFYHSDTRKRLRLLESVIEKDPRLSAIYDQILEEQKKKRKGSKTKDE